MLVLIGSYLFFVFILPVALTLVIGYRGLPVGRACPACTSQTLRLCSTHLRWLSRLIPRATLQRRWCAACGWEGIVRVPRGLMAVPGLAPAPEADASHAAEAASADGAPADDIPESHTAPTHTLDLRPISVDGCDWRVMLQCWPRTGGFYGRLVFIAPTGRLWLDTVEPFAGSSQGEVLEQARSLPDPLLAGRLERLVSGGRRG